MKLGEGTTPAPWHVIDSHDKRRAGYIRRVGAPYGECAVAQVMSGRNWDEWQANARLIAKAPLLIECRDVLADLLGWANIQDTHSPQAVGLRDKVRALLAKLES